MIKSVAEHSKKKYLSYVTFQGWVSHVLFHTVFGVPATKAVPSRKVTPQIALSFASKSEMKREKVKKS